LGGLDFRRPNLSPRKRGKGTKRLAKADGKEFEGKKRNAFRRTEI